MLLNIVKKSMKGPVKIFFGQSKIHVRYWVGLGLGFFVHPVCLHAIFLHYILPCPAVLLGINWWIWLRELSRGKALFVLHVVMGVLSSHLGQSEIVVYGLVGGCVGLPPFSWAIFVLGLALGYMDRLWVFLWVLAVPLLWLVYFCSVVGETSCCPFRGRASLVLLKLSISTSRCLGGLLGIVSGFFDSMVNRIYPSELQLNKANVSDAEASFLDLHLSISDGFVKTKIYDKRDDFDFDVVSFPFLDGDVPRSASCGVCVSQLVRFARVSSHIDDFNTRDKVLTAKLLGQGYRYHGLRGAFSNFYRRHFGIVSKYNVGLGALLLQGLSEPGFCGDLVCTFRKVIGKNDFPYHFKKIIVRCGGIGCDVDVVRRTACLVVGPSGLTALLTSLVARR